MRFVRCAGGPVIPVEVAEEVLLRETRGVQVLDFEVGELRSQPFPQVILGAFGDPAQVAERPPGLGSDLRQLVRAEDDQRDHRQDKQLGKGQIEHAQISVALVRSHSRMSTLNRVGGSATILVTRTG